MELSIKNNPNKKNSFSGNPNLFKYLSYYEILRNMDKNSKIKDEIRQMKYFLKYKKLKKQREKKINFIFYGSLAFITIRYFHSTISKKPLKFINTLFSTLMISSIGFSGFILSETYTVSQNKMYLKELFENKIIIKELLKINKNFLD